MCNYIKDDGEQCGMDNEPFCRHHKDSKQAALHEIGMEMFDGGDMPTGGQFAQLISTAVDIHSETAGDAQSGSSTTAMETHCDECGAALQRRERLSEHPNQTRRIMFEAVVECDCSELVLGSTGVRERNAPNGWSK
jgi:hypothetical protein